jgi:quinol monooxygenase YgiN
MEKHMILSTIRMTIPPPKRCEALKILRSAAELCRDEPACLSCHIYGDLQDKKVLVLEEV